MHWKISKNTLLYLHLQMFCGCVFPLIKAHFSICFVLLYSLWTHFYQFPFLVFSIVSQTTWNAIHYITFTLKIQANVVDYKDFSWFSKENIISTFEALKSVSVLNSIFGFMSVLGHQNPVLKSHNCKGLRFLYFPQVNMQIFQILLIMP